MDWSLHGAEDDGGGVARRGGAVVAVVVVASVVGGWCGCGLGESGSGGCGWLGIFFPWFLREVR